VIATLTASDLSNVLAAAAVLGAAFSVFRSTQLKSSLESMGDANDELRAEVKDHERRRASDRIECDRQLGEMRGQMKVLTSDFGAEIAMAIVDKWETRDAAKDTRAQQNIDRRRDFRDNQRKGDT
jgi:hypothetical protein